MKGRRTPQTIKLDVYAKIVFRTILQHQDSKTGLMSDNANGHAWIRDNVYSILSVWALSMAYKKYSDYDEDRAKSNELERACIKCMRGLLAVMTRQREKIEQFKENPTPLNSIHAKFGYKTGLPVVGDAEWGHLQIDAISLYLLVLAEMTASGLQIIYTLDEVAIVQNLVFYIESAYCIPDYGIWERGDKSNMGILELNSSSIGMAIAALESLDELDLFGVRGGPSSVIHVMPDEIQKCRAVLQSMLPRESMSKETDAALFTVIGYPAFAVNDRQTMDLTYREIMTKLVGRYGCKRFLRDGYKNPKEDSSRLHYEPWELRVFENIECQWPMFFCFSVINSHFMGDYEQADKYAKHLESLLVHTHGTRLVPELYAIPLADVEAELASPGSQEYVPAGRVPFMWAQSLYVISQLLKDSFIACGELDPINRRLSSLQRPEVIVQVVVLAKDEKIKDLLNQIGYKTRTLEEVGTTSNIEVHPARVLSHLYTFLGRSEKLGLTGRRSRDVGILTTSKLYKIQNKVFAFTPQRFDFSRNYMDCDPSLMMTTLEYGLNNLSRCWTASGRPTVSLVMGQNMLENGKISAPMLSILKKLKEGYINGTRVLMGSYEQFLKTTCFTNMSFLGAIEDGNPDVLQPEVSRFLAHQLGKPVSAVLSLLQSESKLTGQSNSPLTTSVHDQHRRKASLKGSIRRSRSSHSRMADDNSSTKKLSSSQKSSRHSSGIFIESNRNSDRNQSDGEDGDVVLDVFSVPEQDRAKILEQSVYSQHDVVELVSMLVGAPTIEEQADILHYLVLCYGPRYKILAAQLGQPKNENVPDKDYEIRDLISTLFEKALVKKNWAIVRQTAGFLGKSVLDLSKAVTDLLVRQKQVTVGMPPHNEVIVSGGVALKSKDLICTIHSAFKGDESMTMLTQELLVYMSMFIQTEPELFHGMLRLRIGLIIQVMVSEMARCLKIKDEDDAQDELMSLSPYEMRNLLHHIMSGREFSIKKCQKYQSGYNIVSNNDRVSQNLQQSAKKHEMHKKTEDLVEEEDETSSEDDSEESGLQGTWLRKRRLDGALNRVPKGFYPKVWMILENCRGIQIRGRSLDPFLTQGMTSGEMKFALEVESVLNAVPEPEFRQLLVEALIMMREAIGSKIVPLMDETIQLEEIVYEANRIFLQEQIQYDGDATTCCVSPDKSQYTNCGGAAGICRFFYDSAPSGQFGTFCYIVKGAMALFHNRIPTEKENIECLPM